MSIVFSIDLKTRLKGVYTLEETVEKFQVILIITKEKNLY